MQTMIPTKGDALYERLIHAFGKDRVRAEIELLATAVNEPLWHLTEEAKDLLLYRLIRKHRSARKYAATSRAIYRKSA